MSKKKKDKKGNIVFENFLDTDTVKKMKDKKKKELNLERQQYFSELSLVFKMTDENTMKPDQFWSLYNDICDNINRVIEEERAV